MSKKNYRAAVIGCGYIGAQEDFFAEDVSPGTHAGAYEDNPRIELVALVDNDNNKLDRAHKIFPKANLYKDTEEMLKKEKIDIVSVCVPTSFHKETVSFCAKYQIPVILCEKPIADSVADGLEMIKICRENDSNLFVHYQRRFDSLIEEWKSKIDSGQLGEIFQARSIYYNGFFNNATHLIDLLLMYFGKPKWVIGRFNDKTTEPEKGKNIDGFMGFKDDIVASFQTVSGFYGFFELEIFGDKGMIKFKNNFGLEIEERKKIKHKRFKGFYELSEKVESYGEMRSMVAQTISYLVSFLDGEVEPKSTGEDSVLVLRTMKAIEESASSGGEKIEI